MISYPLKQFLNFLSSMRLAIVILVTLSIASIIGTVVPQMNTTARYTEIFGLFWTQHLQQLGVFNLYNSIGFLILLMFLLISTSFCIISQTPKIIKEMKRWHAPSIPALSALPFYNELTLNNGTLNQTSNDVFQTIKQFLTTEKWRVKQINEYTVQAKYRPWSKLGYWAAHGGIILVCIGGFLDSQIPLKLQMWWDNEETAGNSNNVNATPPIVHAFSFRSNLFVPEKTTNGQAVINLEKGIALQELPFSLTLNDFNVEHYPTGMPKRFVSDVTITDSETGKKIQQLIEVNKPLRYKGVTVYQSSFEDGGSLLELASEQKNNNTILQVGQTLESSNIIPTKITLDEYRLFNIEDFKEETEQSQTEQSQTEQSPQNLGNSTNANNKIGSFLLNHGSNKTLKNIGDSVRFHITNQDGQIVKYHQYLQPISLKVLNHLGVASSFSFIVIGQQIGNQSMNYLRIPVINNSLQNLLQPFINFKNIIQNKANYKPAILEMLQQNPKMLALSNNKEQFVSRIEFFLELFAQSGYDGLLAEMKKNIPQNKQEQVIPVMIQMVQRLLLSMYEKNSINQINQTNQINLEHINDVDKEDNGWFFQATLAYSQAVAENKNNFPLLLNWKLKEHRYASVFQVAKNPGITLVYLGALLLILGVFIMLYISEQALWFMLQDGTLLVGGRVHKQTIYWKEQTQALIERLKIRI